MSRCPELEVKNTWLLGYDCICAITGMVVGSEYDKTKIDYLCDPRDCSSQYDKCPIYRSKHY